MAAGLVAAGVWIALMYPYLEFEFRIAGRRVSLAVFLPPNLKASLHDKLTAVARGTVFGGVESEELSNLQAIEELSISQLFRPLKSHFVYCFPSQETSANCRLRVKSSTGITTGEYWSDFRGDVIY